MNPRHNEHKNISSRVSTPAKENCQMPLLTKLNCKTYVSEYDPSAEDVKEGKRSVYCELTKVRSC